MGELYLKRKIDLFLREWKNNPERKPLIVSRNQELASAFTGRCFFYTQTERKLILSPIKN